MRKLKVEKMNRTSLGNAVHMCLEMLHLRTLEFQLGFLRAKGRKPHGSKQWDCPSEISELCVLGGLE